MKRPAHRWLIGVICMAGIVAGTGIPAWADESSAGSGNHLSPDDTAKVLQQACPVGARPTYAVLKVDKPPVIDGKLDDPCWSVASPIGHFRVDTADGPMKLDTVARIVRDDTYLYLGVDCTLPGASDIHLQKGSRDNVSWIGENIEFFLHTDRASRRYAQVIFDMTGAFTDTFDGDPRWNGDITAATSVTKTGWQLEARLRISDLGGGGRIDKAVWGANICRSSSDQSGSWAGLTDTFQQPEAFGLLTFCGGGLAVDDVGMGIFGLPGEDSPRIPIRLRLRNPTSQPATCLATFIPTGGEDAVPVRREVTIAPGASLEVNAGPEAPGATEVKVVIAPGRESQETLFETRLPVFRAAPAEDSLLDADLACAIRPAAAVVTSPDMAAVCIAAQSFQDKPQRLSGHLVIASAEDSSIVTQVPAVLAVPAGRAACQQVPLPADRLKVGQYDVQWKFDEATELRSVRTTFTYNPLQTRQLQDLLSPPQATDVLTKIRCPVPQDECDRAIVQVRIDRLAEAVRQQVSDPKADLRSTILARYEQLMQLVSQLRRDGPYTARQKGWFEAAAWSPVDGSAQPYSLFVPYDYDKNPGRKYPLVVHLHAGGGNHGGPGYRAGLDWDITDRLILRPLSRGGSSTHHGIAATDALLQIRDVIGRYRVDADAVHVYGSSSGGFGSFSIAAIFPDVFATCMPFCGGGVTVPVEQMSNLPTFVHHGLADTTVAADLSIFSVLRMQAERSPVQFYLHEGVGHAVAVPGEHLTSWQTRKDIRRDTCPRCVVLAGGIPQLKHAYWLSILRYQDIHKPSYLRAEFTSSNHLVLTSRNVSWAKINLPCEWIDPDKPLQITDGAGRRWTEVTAGKAKDLYVHTAADKIEAMTQPTEKLDDQTAYIGGGAHSMSWLGRAICIVYGTAGPPERTAALSKLAADLRRWNFGGGDFDTGGYPVLADKDISEDMLARCDLIVLGSPRDNSLLARMADRLPVKVTADQVSVPTDPRLSWPSGEVMFSLFYQNPLAGQRRIWWFAGVDDRKAFDKLTTPTTLPLLGDFMPELVVMAKSSQKVVGMAWLDSQWRLARPGPLALAKSVWPDINGLMEELNQHLKDNLPVDVSVVCRPSIADMFDWDSLTVGEALLLAPAEPLMTATVSGEGLLKGREGGLRGASRFVKTPVIAWAGPRLESIDPKAEYRILVLPGSGVSDEMSRQCYDLRDCRLVPAEDVESIRKRWLQEGKVHEPIVRQSAASQVTRTP